MPHFFSPSPKPSLLPEPLGAAVSGPSTQVEQPGDKSTPAVLPPFDFSAYDGIGEEVKDSRSGDCVDLSGAGGSQAFGPGGVTTQTESVVDLSPPNPRFPDRMETNTFSDWLAALRARLVNVPANGSCFFYALYSIKWHDLRYANIGVSKLHAREATFYRRQIVAILAVNLTNWIQRGFLSVQLLRDRYVPGLAGYDDRVRTFLLESAGKSVWQQLGRLNWTDTEEIMAAVWYLREPVYILDVLPSKMVYVQMYHLDVVDGVSEKSGECVRIRLLDSATAHRILVTKLNYRAVLLVLALHHAEGGGHFTGVRFLVQYYTEWNVFDSNKESTVDRLRVAHHALGIPVFLPWTAASAPKVRSESIFGLYFEPSEQSSSPATDLSQESVVAATEAPRVLSDGRGSEGTEAAGVGTVDRTPGHSQNSDFDLEATWATHLRFRSSPRLGDGDSAASSPKNISTTGRRRLLEGLAQRLELHRVAMTALDRATAQGWSRRA